MVTGEPDASMAGAPASEVEGEALLGLVRDLYPLNRSLTGDGVRATLAMVSRVLPLTIHEVPTGTRVLDWEVPPEWNVREAWVEAPDGTRIADFARHNLHLVGYSIPVDTTLDLEELQPHLHSDPARPDVIPYRTSYYSPAWGFCLSHRVRESLAPGRYRVRVDTTLAPGHLSYGEACIPGETADEFLIYTHTCHPSLANDNLSGIAVAAWLGRWLSGRRNRLSYRLVFGPGTIGSITWLARNRDGLGRIRSGLVLALLGDRGGLRYKRSWEGTALIDRCADAWFRHRGMAGALQDFEPWGYDERQFASPGFRLPVGRLTRSAEEGYPEYHSSADNLDLVSAGSLAGSLAAVRELVAMADQNQVLRSLAPYGEPQLGRRGLYRSLGGPPSPELQRACLWVLACGDGEHDLVHAHARSGLPWSCLVDAAALLRSRGLLQ